MASATIYFMGIYQFPEAEAKTEYKEGVVKIEKPVLTTRDWIFSQTRKAGLKDSDIECLIIHESGWNTEAYHINNDKYKSLDMGIWMLNDHWQGVSRACAFDLVCSTNFALKIIKEKGYQPWHGYTGNCIN